MKNRMMRVVLALCMVLVLGVGWAFAAEVALTSVGQSPDGTMIKVIMKKIKIPVDYDKMMTPDALGEQKVLIAVVGGSSKGLGAAGVDKDEEKTRAQKLVTAAREKGMKILVMHVGGKGRRGKLSDMFIEAVTPMADKLILVEGGNFDDIFTNLAGEGVEILSASSVKKTADPLKKVLSGWGVGK